MTLAIIILTALTGALALLNIYQYLIMRSALRIAEILYVMSRNVRAKASEVRRSKKDVEIIEAHLFDIATSARSLLKSLGRSEKSIDPDPTLSVATNGHRMSSDSLIRLADNVFYAVREENPEFGWDESVEAALERFQRKVPGMEREAVRKIITVVASEHRTKAFEQLAKKDDFEEAMFASANKDQ